MDKQDKIITIAMISLSAIISLLALPEATTHISAHNTPDVAPAFFQNVELEAKAAYVYDLTNNTELFAKNASQNLPLASLTKIMTAITAAELAPTSATVVTIDTDSLAESGDNGLYADERWDLTKILQFMLVVSSNDAASAVAESLGPAAKSADSSSPNKEAFITAMNDKARALELNSLTFFNPSGLDESDTQAGAYGSAKDVAHLLAYASEHERPIVEPTRYEKFEATSLDGINHAVQNTDIIIHQIPSLIAGKTGYTVLAGGNLAVIIDAGFQHPIAVVVLGSSYEGRFDDVKKLIDASVKTIFR